MSFGFPFVSPGNEMPNFGAFFNGHQQRFGGNVSPQQNEKKGTPPANEKAIQGLPKVNVTADDIQEESNKECMICLQEHRVGALALKLPCSHLFHIDCAEEWLKRKCTCPICNYELETDDNEYEIDRTRRMRDRKPRCRKDELEKKTVSQLREMMKTLCISTTGCYDKRDLVDRIVTSDKILVVESVPPLEISTKKLYTMGVNDLRHLLLSYGLSTTGAIEKGELIQRLIESGRIIVLNDSVKQDEIRSTISPTPPSPSPPSPSAYSFIPKKSGNSGKSSISPTDSPNPTSPTGISSSTGLFDTTETDPPPLSHETAKNGFEIHEDALTSMSIRDLKSIMTAFGISYVGCVEREDIIHRFENSKNVIILKSPS
eukprot:gene3491-6949_t